MIFDDEYLIGFCCKNNIKRLNNINFGRNYCYEYNISDDMDLKNTLFTMGIGLNNEPHLLTIIQLMNMVTLQKMGYSTQIVLGDVDVALARNHTGNKKGLIAKYKRFLTRIGYDCSSGILRTQFEECGVAKNLLIISQFVNDLDFDLIKEDIIDYYNDSIYEIDFKTKVSYVLMLSDFITPILSNEYKNVIVCSGIDESKYVILANDILKRMNIAGKIGGVFTSIVKGLNGHPKMSKSQKNSCIFLNDDEKIIKSLILDGYQHGIDSIQFQLSKMLLVNHSVEDLLLMYKQNNNEIDGELLNSILLLCKIWRDC